MVIIRNINSRALAAAKHSVLGKRPNKMAAAVFDGKSSPKVSLSFSYHRIMPIHMILTPATFSAISIGVFPFYFHNYLTL